MDSRFRGNDKHRCIHDYLRDNQVYFKIAQNGIWFKMKKLIQQFSQGMFAPTDVASVVLFRVGFGLLMFWEITRYFYFGWVEELFAKPQFHFQYEYFRWVVPIPGIGMYLIFASLGVLALMIACGLFYRIATILFFLGYTYVFLLDQALSLIHI